MGPRAMIISHIPVCSRFQVRTRTKSGSLVCSANPSLHLSGAKQHETCPWHSLDHVLRIRRDGSFLQAARLPSRRAVIDVCTCGILPNGGARPVLRATARFTRGCGQSRCAVFFSCLATRSSCPRAPGPGSDFRTLLSDMQNPPTLGVRGWP